MVVAVHAPDLMKICTTLFVIRGVYAQGKWTIASKILLLALSESTAEMRLSEGIGETLIRCFQLSKLSKSSPGFSCDQISDSGVKASEVCRIFSHKMKAKLIWVFVL